MTTRRSHPALILMLCAAALLALALRIAAAQGDYWLDEAWSALFAREAATPARVFFAINHDNNHFLNTLWLQLVGWGNAPMLGRALAIMCGVASTIVAGLIGMRRGAFAAGAAALLFALSPAFVTYGSEARGYGPMLLALLAAIWIVDRALFGKPPPRHAPIWLGLATLFGMLAHVSMLIGVAALVGWVAFEQYRRHPLRIAIVETIGLTGRATVAVMAVLALIIVSAAASPLGFRMGVQTEFAFHPFIGSFAAIVAHTIGWPFDTGVVPALLLALPLMLLWQPALRDRAPFYLIAIVGLPLAVAILRPDNAAHPRYYLLSAVALLLMIADLAATARPRARTIWTILVLGMLGGGLVLDQRLIAHRRGDPGRAVAVMATRAPLGTTAMIDNPRDSAVLQSAAATRGYRLEISQGCDDARFLFFERNRPAPFQPVAARCGAVFRPVATGFTEGLSGMDWRLYERVR